MNKTLHEQVSMPNTKLKNVFSHYIPNKYVTIDDKDPPWMTKSIKDKIDFKNISSNQKILLNYKNLQQIFATELAISDISIRKEKYYDHPSVRPNASTRTKMYW